MRLRLYMVLLAAVIMNIIILVAHPRTFFLNFLVGLNEILTKINEPMDNFRDFLVSLLAIIVSFFLIYTVILLFQWLRKNEGVFIQPFIVGCCDDNYNGNAISDLLIAELLRIRNVHTTKKSTKSDDARFSKAKTAIRNIIGAIKKGKFPSIKSTSKTKQDKSKQGGSETNKLILPSFIHSSENLAYNISNVNISGGPVTISIGQMLILLKKINGRPVNTITGSIQKYGATINLVAWIGGLKIGAWDVKRDAIFRAPLTGDDYDLPEDGRDLKHLDTVLDMVRELAFKIAKDISMTEIEAKTWLGLKLYTEALEEYNQYRIQEGPDKLKHIRELCIEAAKAEKGYIEPAKLLSDLGTEYYYKGKYEESIQTYDIAIDINSQLAEAWKGKGNAFCVLGKLDDAIKAFDIAIELNPDLAEAWGNSGWALNSLDRYMEGLKFCEKAIELNPDLAEAWNNKGWALNGLGEYTEGLKACEKAIELNPDLAWAWNNKGWALNSLGEYTEGLKACEKAIELNPDLAWAWNNKGWALNSLGEYTKGLKACEKAIELKPDLAMAWINKGGALNSLGRLTESLNAYEKAIELEPDLAMAWINKGSVLNSLGRLTESLNAYEKAIELEPDLAMAWINKGWALRALDRTADAEDAFAKARELGYTG
jgi:tetratricopeptide (TPR) repeat protein